MGADISRLSHRIEYLSSLKRSVSGRRAQVEWSYSAPWCRSVGSDIRRLSHRMAYQSSPEEECERVEGPGRVELLGRLVPLYWEQTSADRHTG